MKRCLLVLFIVLLLLVGACANTSTTDETSADTSVTTPESTPTPTPTPDFSGTDFSSMWYVAELIDSQGNAVSKDEMQNMGADVTLELLADGAYFVYDKDGAVLGQGVYSVTLNQLVLTAASEETVYEIQDEDTFRCTLTDSSITIMKRSKESEDADTVIDDSADTIDNDDEDTVSADDTSDAEPLVTDTDDTSGVESPSTVTALTSENEMIL